ncbi:MAG: hypothetical protein K0R17_2259 [Rariglobus sp.]|jgi:hypothetical protein|nr:hypothetical protein [Microvirga sp.]MDF3058044.1 hypothetical protein [Rariglobus sp.]
MNPEYQKPILVSVLQISGVIGAVFALIIGLREANDGNVGAGIMVIAGGLGSLVFSFGLAQCVDFLGRTAHNTGVLVARSPQPATPARSPFINMPAKDAAWEKAQRGE